MAEIQRSRLFAAAVRAVEELGYSQATVAHITRRARVSRRTFYELFANREECLLAALESVVDRIRREIAAAGLEGLVWRERVRGGLWVILSFFDREPVLARVCVVQALRGSQTVLERREEILAELPRSWRVGARRAAAAASGPPHRGGPGGRRLALVYRVCWGDSESLTELLSPLMGMIVRPYLGPARPQGESRSSQVRSAAQDAVAKDARRGEGASGDPLRGSRCA